MKTLNITLSLIFLLCSEVGTEYMVLRLLQCSEGGTEDTVGSQTLAEL